MGLQGDKWAGGPGKGPASAAQEIPVLPAWGALSGEVEGIKCSTSVAKVQGELLNQGCMSKPSLWAGTHVCLAVFAQTATIKFDVEKCRNFFPIYDKSNI